MGLRNFKNVYSDNKCMISKNSVNDKNISLYIGCS